jgi:hypothetical protein
VIPWMLSRRTFLWRLAPPAGTAAAGHQHKVLEGSRTCIRPDAPATAFLDVKVDNEADFDSCMGLHGAGRLLTCQAQRDTLLEAQVSRPKPHLCQGPFLPAGSAIQDGVRGSAAHIERLGTYGAWMGVLCCSEELVDHGGHGRERA